MSQKRKLRYEASSIPDKGWLENEMFHKQKRDGDITTIAIMAFTLIITLLAFVETGNPTAFLVLALFGSVMAVIYTVNFYFPRFIRVSENGIQLRYYGPWSDSMIPWDQIGVLTVEVRPYGLLERKEAYLLRFHDHGGKKPIFDSCSGLPSYSSGDREGLKNKGSQHCPEENFRGVLG